MQKLEERIRELVCKIDDEERRKADSLKNLRKTERGVKEYIYRSGEDQKNSERIKVMTGKTNIEFTSFMSCQDLIDKLQHQVRLYKKQLEEAEDIDETEFRLRQLEIQWRQHQQRQRRKSQWTVICVACGFFTTCLVLVAGMLSITSEYQVYTFIFPEKGKNTSGDVCWFNSKKMKSLIRKENE